MNKRQKEKSVQREVFGGFVHTREIKRSVSSISSESLYPLIIIPDDPHACKPVEPILGSLVGKELGIGLKPGFKYIVKYDSLVLPHGPFVFG